MNAAAAHAGTAERARTGAIAQIQLRHIGFLRSRHRNRRFRRVCAGEAVAIQAQMQNRPPTDRQVGRHIARQIDISNLVPEFSGGADRNPFPFIGNLALAVPRLPFHVLMGVIERTAAVAVVSVRCDGDGRGRGGRRRVVVGLPGVGVDLIFTRCRKGKVTVDHGVLRGVGSRAQHLVIRHGRVFPQSLHGEEGEELLTDAYGVLGELHGEGLGILYAVHRRRQTDGDGVAVRRRGADDGALAGLAVLQYQLRRFGEERGGLILVVPAVGHVLAAEAAQGHRGGGQRYRRALPGSQRVGVAAAGDACAGNGEGGQRRIDHGRVPYSALCHLIRAEPGAVCYFIAAEFPGALPIQEAAGAAGRAAVDNEPIGAASALERHPAGIAVQLLDGAVIDDGDLGAVGVRYIDPVDRRALFDLHGAGLAGYGEGGTVLIDHKLGGVVGVQRRQRGVQCVIPCRAPAGADACGGLAAADRAGAVVVILMRHQRRVGLQLRQLVFALLVAERHLAALALPVRHRAPVHTGGTFRIDILHPMTFGRELHPAALKFVAGAVRIEEEIIAAGALPAVRRVIAFGADGVGRALRMKYHLRKARVRRQLQRDGIVGVVRCQMLDLDGLIDLLVAEIHIGEGVRSDLALFRTVAGMLGAGGLGAAVRQLVGHRDLVILVPRGDVHVRQEQLFHCPGVPLPSAEIGVSADGERHVAPGGCFGVGRRQRRGRHQRQHHA